MMTTSSTFCSGVSSSSVVAAAVGAGAGASSPSAVGVGSGAVAGAGGLRMRLAWEMRAWVSYTREAGVSAMARAIRGKRGQENEQCAIRP